MRQLPSQLSRRSFVAAGACATVASLGVLAGCATETAAAPEPKEEAPESAPEPASEPAADLADTGEESVIYIVDRLVAKPGEGKAVLDDFMANMKPLIEGAGWRFKRATVAPAMWLDTDSNIIEIEWTMGDIVQEAWAYSSGTRYNPEYVQWWTDIRDRLVSNDRVYSAPEGYMEVLNNV
ncbi:hypothetical protein [Adlercreutzia caecimuris]|uniref:Tat (Twin-arginine translocation) pathway signal sequence n=1 Tax=Adlercreutzia caecimuris B7 TaxID=1235794 RepID=R9KUH9_9ACTN|nr:hypothetical protein [Adlercreutzia caecimuris]EOS50209.1 hypothetical protein C811_01833 [Adlercreutzia caecimuris B7]